MVHLVTGFISFSDIVMSKRNIDSNGNDFNAKICEERRQILAEHFGPGEENKRGERMF